MKYLALFLLLILAGAGCTAKTISQTDLKTESTDTTADNGGEEAVAEYPDASVETKAGLKTETTIKTDEGAEIIVETEESVSAEEDADVPVVDFVLGDAKTKIDMEATNFSFSPKNIEVNAGEKVQIMFTKNVGFHTFVIDEISLKHAVKQGEALSFTAPKEPGTYPFYCDIGSHRAQGMEGTLVVK